MSLGMAMAIAAAAGVAPVVVEPTLAEALLSAADDSLHSLYLGSETATNAGGRFRLLDLGPSGRHLDSPSSGADPTVSTAIDMGGMSVVKFDGATQYLVSVAAASAYNSLSDGTECAVIALAENLTPTVFQDFIGTANSNTQTGIRMSFNTNATMGVIAYNGSSTFASTPAADHMTGRLVSLRVDASTRVIGGNSGKIGAKTAITSPGASASQTLTVGRRPGLSAAYFNGHLAALVVMVKGAESSAAFAARVASVKATLSAAAFSTDPINLICFGNSLTRGVGASDEDRYSYPAQLGALAGGKATVWELGHPGIETPEMNDSEATAAALAARRANNCMVLWEAGNHIHQSDVDAATALAAYTTLTNILRENGYEGIILGPTITNRTSFDAGHLAAVSGFNAAILSDPESYGLDGAIDLASVASLDPPAADGTHFDDPQYGIIAAAVWSYVEPLFPSATDWDVDGILGAASFSWSRADSIGVNGSGRLRLLDQARYGTSLHWDSPSAGQDPVAAADAELDSVVSFDGSDDRLQSVGAAAKWNILHNALVNAEAWIVGRIRATETLNFACLLGNSSSGTQVGVRVWYSTAGALVWNVGNGTAYVAASCSYTVGDEFILHVTLATDGTLSAECITSTNTTTGSGSVAAPSASDAPSVLILADRPTSSAEIELDLAELVFATNATATRSQIMTEVLRQRYALPGAA